MNCIRRIFRGLQRLCFVVSIVAALLSSLPPVQPLQAAPSPAAAHAPAAALNIVAVGAPDVNCLFDVDCIIAVDDFTDAFALPGATGSAFLQSRTWPVGERGTPGEGLYAYLYRIDLRRSLATTAAPCVVTMQIPFGPVTPLDYDGDGKPDDVFVIARGGLGSVPPTSADLTGGTLTVQFNLPLCTGASSFFFGLASTRPPQDVRAQVQGTLGLNAIVNARAPRPARQTPSARIAYVHTARTSETIIADYKGFLESQGFTVTPVSLDNVLATDFSQFDLTLIGDDTGFLGSWGNAPGQAEHIANKSRVIGIGEGGYAFFGKLGLRIGWPHGWHRSEKDVIGDPSLVYYQTPNDLTGLLGAPLSLYASATDEVGIYLATPTPGVTVLGQEPGSSTHHPLVAQRCHQLWGFNGYPQAMTDVGRKLFINAVVYGLEQCIGFREPVVVTVQRSTNKAFAAAFTLPDPRLVEVQGPDQINYVQHILPGVDVYGNTPGLPDVPIVRRMVAAPAGAEVRIGQVNVIPGETFEIDLWPTQPSAADASLAQGEGELPPETFMDPPFVKDVKAYESDASFPAQPVSLRRMGVLRDVELWQVNVAGGQYNPKRRLLTTFQSVAFELLFEGGEGGFLPREVLDNPFERTFDGVYLQALNRETIFRYPFDRIRQPICIGYEYLIITHPEFRAAADALRDWRVSRGVSTRVIETGGGAGQAGATAEQIRNTVRNYYNNCLVRPSYLLLLGDAEFIPPFYRTTHYGDNAGSDLDYALMTGDDLLPDLAYGRIPVDTLEQAQTVVNKIISYEGSPPTAPHFYRNITLASYFQCCRVEVAQDGVDSRSFIETSELVRNALSAQGYTVERIYTTSTAYHADYAASGRSTTPNRYFNGSLLPADLRAGSGFAWNGNAGDIVNAINAGQFLVMHRGHGSPSGWAGPSFSTGNLSSLNNGALTPVIYSINCASGLFDNETLNPAQQAWNYGVNAGGAYWAERILRMEGGAVGVIGDTRNSPTWANSALARGLFDATFPTVLPAYGPNNAILRLGDILNYGKAYMVSQVGQAQTAGSVSANEATTNLILYHVFGDPAMQMWTRNPHQIVLPPHIYRWVTLTPRRWLLEYPIDGAAITALQQGNPVARGVVIGGQATLDFLTDVDPNQPIDLSAELSGGISTPLGAADAQGVVEPQGGGEVSHAPSKFRILFGDGSVRSSTHIFYNALGHPRRLLNQSVREVRRFTLEAFAQTSAENRVEPVTQFERPYTIVLEYTDAEVSGLNEASLRCQYVDANGEWQPIASEVEAASNRVLCSADHFTEFALVGDALQQLFLPVVSR